MSSGTAAPADARTVRARHRADPAAAPGSPRRQKVLAVVQGALLVGGVFGITIILALQAAATYS